MAELRVGPYPSGYGGGPHPVLSQPIKLFWAGWESTTSRLQQAGWQISAREDVSMDQMQIALQHREAGMRGLSNMLDFQYMRNRFDLEYSRSLVVHVPWMAPDIKVIRGDAELMGGGIDFRAVDARPQMAYDEVLLSDFAHFAVPMVRSQEIIVPEEDVNAILSRILEKQEAAKQKYFEEKVRDERFAKLEDLKPMSKFHAQIISIADHRRAA